MRGFRVAERIENLPKKDASASRSWLLLGGLRQVGQEWAPGGYAAGSGRSKLMFIGGPGVIPTIRPPDPRALSLRPPAPYLQEMGPSSDA